MLSRRRAGGSSDIRRHRTRLASLFLVASVFGAILVPGSATRAEQVVDQQQTVHQGAIFIGGGGFQYQTFTAGRSGPLDRVDLKIGRNSDFDCDLIITIDTLTPLAVIASTSIRAADLPASSDNFFAIPFPSPAVVTSGTQYRVVVNVTSGCAPGTIVWAISFSDPYPGGRASTGALDDFAFKTFVRLPSPTLVSPANGSTTSDSTPLFSGTADTGAGSVLTQVTIQVFQGTSTSGTPFGTLTADPDDGTGAFAASPATALPPGTYLARVRQNNGSGETGTSNANVFAVEGTGTGTGTGSGTGTGTGTGTGPGTGTGTGGAPDTTITSPLFEKTRNRTPTFTFISSEAGSRFECSVDGGAFAACTSPFTLPTLRRGGHNFLVRAIDTDGNVDPSPARADFKIKKHRRR